MKQVGKPIQSMWHAERADAVLASWNSSDHGLSVAEAKHRQQQYGLNVLPEKGPTPLWKIVRFPPI